MPYYSKNKCVYKKDTNKKVGCTKGPVKKYLSALYAATANESIETAAGSNLHFKNIRFPSKKLAIATYHYESKKDNVDVMVYYTLGKTAEETEYCHTEVKDNNDIHSKPISFEDPQSQELQEFSQSKKLNITENDIETAGQDGFSRIESHFVEPAEAEQSYEESFSFEPLFHSIVNEKKS